MLRGLVIAVICCGLCGVTVATASTREQFATAVGAQVEAVKLVHSARLIGGDFTDILIGTIDQPAGDKHAALVLLQCTTSECTSRRVDFGRTSEIGLVGVFELAGKPTAIPDGHSYAKVFAVDHRRFPVVAVRTTDRDGSATTSTLHMVSLIEADRGSLVLQDTQTRIKNRAGFRRSYRLDTPQPADDKPSPAPARGQLELVIIEQRLIAGKCLPAKPVELRFRLDGHHFRQAEGVIGDAAHCR